MINKVKSFILLFALACVFQSCKKHDSANSAFYYWKSRFSLDSQQRELLKTTSANKIYLRFFDISWDNPAQKAYPNAIVTFGQSAATFNVTPVIFIANKTFENLADTAINTLAVNSNNLINRIAVKANINYQALQFDCDWTLSTRDKYFKFLKAFKNLTKKELQATIRLHQVKYKQLTGVPPVNKGVLMFYNMGTLNNNLQQPNSIYNAGDAEKYMASISGYPLQLDIALPLFSWAIQIREGKMLQLYSNPNKKDFINTQNFEFKNNAYIAKKSFFLNGVYIKQSDIFKLEVTDVNSLKKASAQLSAHLPHQTNRTIIYYELGNLNLSEFKAETINQVSADF